MLPYREQKRIDAIVNYHLERIETMGDYTWRNPKKKGKKRGKGNELQTTDGLESVSSSVELPAGKAFGF